MGRLRMALAAVLVGTFAVSAAAAPADDLLRAETDDWILTAPAAIVTQPDLELLARGMQLCSNEIELLTGYRPPQPPKFTATWMIDGLRGSSATPTGIVSHVPSASYRIVEDLTRPFFGTGSLEASASARTRSRTSSRSEARCRPGPSKDSPHSPTSCIAPPNGGAARRRHCPSRATRRDIRTGLSGARTAT